MLFRSDLHEIARAAIARWALPAATSLSLFNLSENAIFRLTTPAGEQFALRIHRPGYQADAAIRSLDAVTFDPLPGADAADA